ncbi:MAG TPA: hypothetical protein VJJ23_04175 [Candidatus Nanoarchaeia archaeon]|nr:hypothetical protein [Candidatus Nanoarchaeia archaeon]
MKPTTKNYLLNSAAVFGSGLAGLALSYIFNDNNTINQVTPREAVQYISGITAASGLALSAGNGLKALAETVYDNKAKLSDFTKKWLSWSAFAIGSGLSVALSSYLIQDDQASKIVREYVGLLPTIVSAATFTGLNVRAGLESLLK